MASITIQATDGSGSFSAYLVEPKTKPAGVVVLIQEIFGVNQAMRDIAAWVADMRFIAVCPDLFWRIEPGIDITDKSEAEWKKAFELFNKFDQAKGIEDLKATVAAARKLPGANGRVATMGYCLGGRLAFMMAEQSDADVNISYYGVGLDNLLGDLAKVTKPLIVHIADKDEFFPPEGRAKVVEAVKGHKQIAAYVYPDADHAFARVGGVHWDGRSAAIANGRSAEALVAAPRREGRLHRSLPANSDVRRDPVLQPALRQRADLRRGGLAVLEQDQRRDAAHRIVVRRHRVVVDVHLGDRQLAGELAGEFLQRRADHLAGAAPLGPEVHQHRSLGLQHVGGECLVGDGFGVRAHRQPRVGCVSVGTGSAGQAARAHGWSVQ